MTDKDIGFDGGSLTLGALERERRNADRIAALIEERETLLGENARLGGIINFMMAANAMQGTENTDSVSDELVKLAWEAFESLPMDAHYSQAMRVALSAIAPRLRADGMREAVKSSFPDKEFLEDYTITEIREAILARAQELDPK